MMRTLGEFTIPIISIISIFLFNRLPKPGVAEGIRPYAHCFVAHTTQPAPREVRYSAAGPTVSAAFYSATAPAGRAGGTIVYPFMQQYVMHCLEGADLPATCVFCTFPRPLVT